MLPSPQRAQSSQTSVLRTRCITVPVFGLTAPSRMVGHRMITLPLLSAKLSRMQTRSINLSGLTFTVDIAGPDSGAPVLLLHGFPETRHMWRHQIDALARAGFRAIAPDQRGYSTGARPSDPNAYQTDLIVADALALMDALGAP